MATLTVAQVTRVGIASNMVAAAGGGDVFLPGNNTFLDVNNGSGGSITVTIAGKGSTWPNVTTPDLVVAVAAGARKRIGPFPPALYADPTTGLASVTYSGVTSLTVEPVNLTQP